MSLDSKTKQRIRKFIDDNGDLSLRAKKILEHIYKNGSINTDEISSMGYGHPPRAARDVRDAGFPLETKRIKVGDKRIAQYIPGNLDNIEGHKLKGRTTLPVKLKNHLFKQNSKCYICSASYEKRYYQVDHRIPYAIGGDPDVTDHKKFMLLCASCQRSKSWSCEHCPNWNIKQVKTCENCYWAKPDNYDHVATKEERRLTIVFSGIEVESFDAFESKQDLINHIKSSIK